MSPRKSFGSLKSQVEPVRPFLKWAGGKGQLLKKFKSLYPAELVDGKIMTYCEPCIGSGAVFFEIVQNLSTEYEELKKRIEILEGEN